MAAAVASAAEWYDFFIFGTAAALVFGKLFFPTFSPVAGVFASFGTFAIGFLARPLGAVLFGHFGDRAGRKPVLLSAMLLMGGATTLVGLMPSYDTIGELAPILLVLLRFLQGLAIGGQWGGAVLMATEYAPEGKRGRYGSLVQLGVPVGILLGNGAFLMLSTRLTPEQFLAWGWRVPFIGSFVLVILTAYMALRVEETPVFKAIQNHIAEDSDGRSPVTQVLHRDRVQVMLAAGTFMVVNGAFYVLVTGMLDYTVRGLGLDRSAMLSAVTIACVAQLVTVPLFAIISDLVGRRPVFCCGAVMLALWSFPLIWFIDTRSYLLITYALGVAQVMLAMMYGPMAALFTELFAANTRYSGVSLSYQLGAVLGGSLSPMVVVALLERTADSASISWYVCGMAVISLLSVGLIRKFHSDAVIVGSWGMKA
jgi:MFS family permease